MGKGVKSTKHVELDEGEVIFALQYGKKDIHKIVSNHVRSIKDRKTLKTFMDKVLEVITERLLQRIVKNDSVIDEWFKTFRVYITSMDSFLPKDGILRLVPRVTRLDCFAARGNWLEGAPEAKSIIDELAVLIGKGKNSYLPQMSSASSDCFASVLAPTVQFMFACYSVKAQKSISEYSFIYDLGSEYSEWCREHGTKEETISLVKPLANNLIKIITDLVNQEKYSDSKFSLAKKLIGVVTSLCVSITDSSLLSLLHDSLFGISSKMQAAKDQPVLDFLDFQCETILDIMAAKNTKSDFETEFFVKWCDACNLLVQVLKKLDVTHAQETIIQLTTKWDLLFSNRLPGPIPVVGQWVQIQIENGLDDVDSPTLLGEVCVNEISRKKILHQELLVYVQMQHKNAKFCKMMQGKINDFLNKDNVVTPRCWLEEARNLRSCGFSPGYCILNLNQIIRVASGVQLGMAYCIRALCMEEYRPNSKNVFADIKHALPLLKDQISVDSMVPPMEILYSILDLLSLKGRIDLHCAIYEVMVNSYTQKKLPLKNLLVKLWEFRRLSHALCPSPILDTFINLSDLFGDELMQTNYWIESFGTSQPLTMGFNNNFPFSQSNIPICEIKQTASQLNNGSHTGQYQAGYMYYDLCELLVSHGRSVEALPYAMEAFQLRSGLFLGIRGIFPAYKTTGKELVHFRSIASELWSFDTNSRDLEICFITPWNLLRCYLESCFQVGVVLEILGNEKRPVHM